MSFIRKVAGIILGALIILVFLKTSTYALVSATSVQKKPNRAKAPKKIIVKTKPSTSRTLAVQSLGQSFRGLAEGTFTGTYAAGANQYVYSVTDVKNALSAARANSNVESARVDPIIVTDKISNDEFFSSQWALIKMKVAGTNNSTAWDEIPDLSTSTNAIKVAILDTGVDKTHPDLAAKFTSGSDWVDCTADPCRNNSSSDNFGHGTHVAGIVGAVTDNAKGIAGVGYNVKLMSVRVLNNDGFGTLSDALRAIRYAADNGARIINMSWGSTEQEMTSEDRNDLQGAIDYAYGKGAVLIAAAGNCGMSPGCDISDPAVPTPTYVLNPKVYPAASNHILSVAALKRDNTIAPYSENGNWIGIAAPGGYFNCPSTTTNCTQAVDGILSTYPAALIPTGPAASPYAYLIGTSMAAPNVSGVAALILAAKPTLTNEQVVTYLKSFANGQVAGTGTKFQSGAVDACRSVYAAVHSTAPGGILSPDICTESSGGGGAIPTLTPFPTGNVCAKTCKEVNSSYTGKERSKGDYNCSGTVSKKDFNVWKRQFNTIPGANGKNNANGRCRDEDKSDPNSYLVNLTDFELWRRNAERFGKVSATGFDTEIDEEGD